MSIGMMLEIMAAKSASVKGEKYIHKTFAFSETLDKRKRNNYVFLQLAESLKESGLDYYGTEKFYSGTSGEELEADVFCGFVYYLRLHHFVESKYQVRSTGPINELTRQPLNQSRSGAIRVGEMEKDAILSHGAAELIMDRLLHNSDECTAYVCSKCQTLLYPTLQHHLPEHQIPNFRENTFCKICNIHSRFKVKIPYVLVYLVAELSAVGIKLKFRGT